MKRIKEMQKAIEEARTIYSRAANFTMVATQWLALAERAVANPLDAITDAFDFGFAKGVRYQKAQEKKKRGGAKIV